MLLSNGRAYKSRVHRSTDRPDSESEEIKTVHSASNIDISLSPRLRTRRPIGAS